ncbi:MAG: undecaprenyl/decaprenyl-phosphate alpha-N-acetylglucosaminyl 1-phosphate transferase [Planctomycetaceae bacterium]|nr:undecaprenyl/decaprenyl-phosphate alpha-N-acetylglucosaminyl 1-phosphate transferase [Planctomycetaceae bacterium]
MTVLLVAFAIALMIAAAVTPVVRILAIRIGLVDRPDGHRKLHLQTIALGGGLAVAISSFLGGLLAFWLFPEWHRPFMENARYLTGLSGAAGLICLVGILDDWLELRGRQKLAAQVGTILIVVLGGLVIEQVEVFGLSLDLGLLAVPITVCWLLGTINALNLIDGVDGLAATVGIILSVALAAMAWTMGHQTDALVATALAGGLLGFLIYNAPPAKIYLGDAGSMTIGLVLGALAIRSSLKGPATVTMVAPVLIWAILLFDVGAAILRRKLTGQSVYTTDRGHLHHVLQKRGYSGAKVVLIIGGLCMLCAGCAMISVFQKSELMAVGTGIAVIVALIASGVFGHSEFTLLLRRLKNLSTSMIRIPTRPARRPEPVMSRFGGHRDWELLWDALIDYAEKFDLSLIQLNVNSPSIGEEYHAFWERKEHPPLLRMWRTEIPLFHGKLAVGRLTICGTSNDSSACAWMAELIEGLRPFEIQMRDLLETSSESPASAGSGVPIAG